MDNIYILPGGYIEFTTDSNFKIKTSDMLALVLQDYNRAYLLGTHGEPSELEVEIYKLVENVIISNQTKFVGTFELEFL